MQPEHQRARSTETCESGFQTVGRPDRRELPEGNQAGLTAEQAGMTAEQANVTAQNPDKRQAGLTAKPKGLPIGGCLPIGAKRAAESGLGGGGHS